MAMQLSVTSWSFPACTLGEAWDITRALGIGAIDIGLLHGPSLDRAAILADPEAAAAALAPLGLKVANLYWLFGAGLADRALTDPDALSRNIEDFGRVARFARAMGASSIFVLPGVATPGLSKARLIDRSAASLRALLPVARSHGVALTVEPHVGGILGSPEDTLALIDAVPGLTLALDYAHFVCMGFTQDRIDALAPHAGHVHLRQARPGALQAKWGEGTIDFGAMVEVLSEAGYRGHLAIEYVHQSYMNTLSDDVLTETIRMRDFLRGRGIA